MINVDEKTVLECARLAQVRIDEARLPILKEELIRMLDFVKTLDEVNTSELEPTVFVAKTSNVTREDVPKVDYNPKALIESAPVSKEGYVVVPGVIE